MYPKISIIIPIYNIEDFLEDTLKCLVNQTFINEIEVLMIDDGSTDNSRYIVEKYALDYDNFHAFHKTNGGSSSARNYGIDHAKGEYIHFLDGDDYVAQDSYERLYKIATEHDSDIVTAPIVRFKRYNLLDGIFYKNSLKNIPHDIYETRFEANPELIWDLFITNKLYKKDFLDKNNLRLFEIDRAYCDDVPFSLKSYLLAENISISTDFFYYWRIRENNNHSQTQNVVETENFLDRMHSIKMCNDIFREDVDNEVFKESFYRKILDYDLYTHFSKFHVYGPENHSEIMDQANEILGFVPEKIKEQLVSFKKIIFKMVEHRDIEELSKFTEAIANLKQDSHALDYLSPQYSKYIDLEKEALDKTLFVKSHKVYLDNDDLNIEFKEGIKYLDEDYPHRTIAKLIDGNGEEHPLKLSENKISIPIELILDRNHMRIMMEYVADSFTKERFLTNYKRKVIALKDCDIEIGVGMNQEMFIDIRPKNDLKIEIGEVLPDNGILEFRGVSTDNVDRVYLQNVITFEKMFYPVQSVKKDSNYEISFSIPHDDIISLPIKKWELRVDGTFNKIRIDKRCGFYMHHNYVYVINARRKLLVSDDIYNSSETLKEYYDKITELREANRDLNKSIKKKDNITFMDFLRGLFKRK